MSDISIKKVERRDHDETMEMSPRPFNSGKHLANPAPLAMGGFATTLLSVSLAMMNFRGVSNQTIFVGDLCFAACIGLLISAQWEMVRGNTFSYTVLSAYAMFYGGYGATLIPAFGIIDAYGGFTADNVVYIIIFLSLELCLIFDAASQFKRADGMIELSENLSTVGGAFAFVASIFGYYTVLHYLCQESLPFTVVMGDTSRFFERRARGPSSSVKASDDLV
ncbi:GPR1/FUN34/yaaH [Penicillium waksmanii]|uniref:GPR1/FUN34/yaaH n=1 Tax=Penicillium waksmanii TaxID=69791 RepID=UPI00254851CD|nr:GPR1/FUN34/yaaH [Penicillium waksmanii]KAJ5988491.1 GPR1/FUN34/yaaH [Penicillium waksmanii]